MSWIEMNREMLRACVNHDNARQARLRRIALRMSLKLHRKGGEGSVGSTIVR